jgi:hypothetical protein
LIADVANAVAVIVDDVVVIASCMVVGTTTATAVRAVWRLVQSVVRITAVFVEAVLALIFKRLGTVRAHASTCGKLMVQTGVIAATLVGRLLWTAAAAAAAAVVVAVAVADDDDNTAAGAIMPSP